MHTGTRYMITCPARSGSSALVSYLRSHPDICSHGEVFGSPSFPVGLYGIVPRLQPPLMDWLIEYRTRDPIGFLDLIFYPGKRRAVGCKFKFEELDSPDNETVVAHIRRDTEIRIIFLTRKNLLERYVSQHLAVHVHKQFNVHKGNPLPPPAAIRLTPSELEEEFALTRQRQERYRELFSRHPVLDVTYEELCRDPEGVLARLQQFLGVDRRSLETQLAKLQQQPMSEVIDNFEGLRAHFATTEHAAFFE